MILYEAKCAGKVVTLIDGANQYPVPDCKIFGNGTAVESKGIIIADQDRFYYIPLATPDLERTLDKMLDICDKLKNVASILSSANTLLDNGSVVVGSASLTPSTITGTEMANSASTVSTEVDTLKTEISNIKKTLV